MLAETAAPSWLPLVFLAIPVALILGVGSWAVRGRRAWSGARQAERRRGAAPAPAAGASVADPSLVSRDALLAAMAAGGATEGRGEPFAATARALGLRSRVSTATVLLEPTVAWGERDGRQVVLRIGPDEEIEGSSVMTSNRHSRSICTLRVDAPAFRVRAQRGRLVADPGSAPGLEAILGGLQPSEIWDDVHARGGADGIVVSRNSIVDPAGRAALDILWLAEHIAGELGLPPLPAARVGPAFRVPYGWGRDVPG